MSFSLSYQRCVIWQNEKQKYYSGLILMTDFFFFKQRKWGGEAPPTHHCIRLHHYARLGGYCLPWRKGYSSLFNNHFSLYAMIFALKSILTSSAGNTLQVYNSF